MNLKKGLRFLLGYCRDYPVGKCFAVRQSYPLLSTCKSEGGMSFQRTMTIGSCSDIQADIQFGSFLKWMRMLTT